MNAITHYRQLNVYQNTIEWVVRIFELTKSFPARERYSLTDRIRRWSRSVYANLGEAWRKHTYEATFISKLIDDKTVAVETQVQSKVILRCASLTQAQAQVVDAACDQINGQIVKMADQPEKRLIRAYRPAETAKRRNAQIAKQAPRP